MPTQGEINVTGLKNRILYTKIQLLNFNLQVVDELSGVVVDSPSFKLDVTSDIRRTMNISLYVKDSSFDIKDGNKIWLDKYIKVYIGIENMQTGEPEYTNMGVYIINNPTRSYSSTTNILSMQCLDLMAKLTGLRNGELEGLIHTIKQGNNVRTSIIGILEFAGFTKYIVEECEQKTVPNDLSISIGGTAYDLLKLLKDLIPQYQMYFDADGVFRYNLIPSGKNEQVMVDDSIWKKTLISYNVDTDFENVKNIIEVHGKIHDIQYYNIATTSGSTYMLSIADVPSLYNNLKIGFTAPNKITDPYINLNSYGAKALKNEDGTFAVLENDVNKYYVAKYKSDGDYFLFMGEVEPKATVEETNPDSPFYVGGTMRRVRKVFSGGEYDNIYMSSLALARAKWELYNYCRLQDTVTITCAPIYWLDGNWVIEITLPNKQGTEEKNKYIIKQISTTLDTNGTQTITMMKYYPFYDTE